MNQPVTENKRGIIVLWNQKKDIWQVVLLQKTTIPGKKEERWTLLDQILDIEFKNPDKAKIFASKVAKDMGYIHVLN